MLPIHKSVAGYTLVELLVSVALAAVIMSLTAAQYFQVMGHSTDLEIKINTNDAARALLDLIVFDLRMLGAGVPFGQANFQIGGAGLGDAPLPLLTSSSATSITFRGNPSGGYSVLTADFTPSSGSYGVTVLSAADFLSGDMVYISDATTGGSDGFQGTITSIVGSTLTLSNSYTASSGAVFEVGSRIEPVTTVTFTSPGNGSGVTRDNGTGAILLTPNSTFTLTYWDRNGNLLTPPLSAIEIRDSLAAIRMTVSVTGQSNLQDGTTYTGQASQTVALRNIETKR